jgi:hypothetical protein
MASSELQPERHMSQKLKGRRSTRRPFVGSLAVERRYYRGATSRVKVMG